MDLSVIEENYRKKTDGQLLKLAGEANTLRPEAVPILIKELVKRGMEEDAMKIDDLINKEEEFDYKLLSLKEIQELVSERLQEGESLESIKADLSDKGVDILHLLNEEGVKREEAYELLSSANGDESKNEELNERFEYDEEELKGMKKEMNSRAKIFVVIGVVLIILSIGVLILFLSSDSFRLRPALVIFGAGSLLLAKGLRQRN